MLTAPLTLRSGVTITLAPWSYREFSAHYTDFRNLIQAFRERAGSQDGHLPQQLLLDRVLLAAVPRQDDRDQLDARDLPELLDAIYTLNRVEDIAGKSLGLYARLLQTEERALEATEPTP